MNQLLAMSLAILLPPAQPPPRWDCCPPGGLSTGEDLITALSNGDQDQSAALTVLNDSLEPLVDRFNKDKGKLRFVTILSPT